ncbi:lytic murein transglycosylase [Inquilinus sp. CAU 1745]|uniref:lytic murein transglycosylase n=1 Tax=Inquilinus sp. CAU 1745 TaxID=3140369 RepID=UPI00325BDD87
MRLILGNCRIWGSAALALALSACASTPAAQGAGGAGTSDAPVAAAEAPQQSFEEWVASFKRQARQEGISPAAIDRAFAGVSRLPAVIEADSRQPEFARPIWDYLDSAVSDQRVARGRALLAEHAALLDAVEQRYGVAPEYLVAIWGLESAYGANFGNYPVISALSTLAYDGSREGYGRDQLMAALRIIEAGDIAPDRMVGSWAGAMGQTQFIPTTYLGHAVDGDGDGRRDIWGSLPDVFSSTANYLAESGWQRGESWGTEVRLPAGFDYGLAELSESLPIDRWRAMGVTRADGAPLTATGEGSIIVPAGHRGPAFLVLDNFRAILRYNNATSYALAIGHLADRLRGGEPFVGDWPRGDSPLSRDDRMDLQQLLTARGYDTGGVDGIIGPMTRDGIRRFQEELGLPEDGYPTSALLERLRALS